MEMSFLQGSLNKSMSEVVCWALANKLPLNEKTKVLIITGKRPSSKIDYAPELSIGSTKLINVSSAKLLGLEIDELSFSRHIDNVCKKYCPNVLEF